MTAQDRYRLEAERNTQEARDYRRAGIPWHQGQPDERPVTASDLVTDRQDRGIYTATEAAAILAILELDALETQARLEAYEDAQADRLEPFLFPIPTSAQLAAFRRRILAGTSWPSTYGHAPRWAAIMAGDEPEPTGALPSELRNGIGLQTSRLAPTYGELTTHRRHQARTEAQWRALISEA